MEVARGHDQVVRRPRNGMHRGQVDDGEQPALQRAPGALVERKDRRDRGWSNLHPDPGRRSGPLPAGGSAAAHGSVGQVAVGSCNCGAVGSASQESQRIRPVEKSARNAADVMAVNSTERPGRTARTFCRRITSRPDRRMPSPPSARAVPSTRRTRGAARRGRREGPCRGAGRGAVWCRAARRGTSP